MNGAINNNMTNNFRRFDNKVSPKNVAENVKLIELVKQFPLLYDTTLDDYKDSTKKENAWIFIALAMEWPVESCQTRWKSLRDSFRKKDKKSPNGCPSELQKWRYRELLSFLKQANDSRKQANDSRRHIHLNGIAAINAQNFAQSSLEGEHAKHDVKGNISPCPSLTCFQSRENSNSMNAIVKIEQNELEQDSPEDNFAKESSRSPKEINEASDFTAVTNKKRSHQASTNNCANNNDNQDNKRQKTGVLLSSALSSTSNGSSALFGFIPSPNSLAESAKSFAAISRDAADSTKKEYDEDELFALSIAATLRKCSVEQKSLAKIEIMRILHVATVNSFHENGANFANLSP